MKHLIACTVALFASFGTMAQNPVEDPLALELERALSSLDSNIAAGLSEQFTNALFRLIAVSMEEAANEMEDAARELNLEVVPNEGSGGVTVVSGARDGDLVRTENELVLVNGTDSLTLEDQLLNDLLDLEEVEEPQDPGHVGYWKGWGLGSVLLTNRPNPGNLNGMELLDSPFDLQTGNALSSWNIQLNPYEYRQPLIGDAIGITTGVGFDWWRFNVSPKTVLTRSETGAIALAVDTTNQVRRNHLSLTYLRVPLLLSLRTQSDPESALHIECGVVGGIRLHNQYVRKYSDSESNYVDKVKGFGMNPLQLNARLVLGYGGFSVFAEVPFRPLWNEAAISDNPLVYPVTLGIKFTDLD